MYAYRFRAAAVTAAAILGLSACATPYGYSGVSVGLGNGYYGSDYGYGYGGGYPGYAYGYGAGYPGYGLGYAPYWGWYDDCYYPGTGHYVYDAYRRPHRWTDAQRRYWTERRERALSSSNEDQRVVIRENWNDFSRNRPAVRSTRVNRNDDQTARIERSSRPVRVERSVRPGRVERIVRSDTRSNATAREQRRSEAATAREQRRSESSATREARASRSGDRGRGNNQDD